MPSFRGCSLPSRRTVVLAVILTFVSSAIWTDQAPHTNLLQDPLTRLSNGAAKLSETFLEHVRRMPKELPSLTRHLSYPFYGLSKQISNFSETLSSLGEKYGITWYFKSLFSPPSDRPFLPSSYYETDRYGAIEVFEKHGMTICRIYKMCRLQNGQLEAPMWMTNHSVLLQKKCGLSSLLYKPTWTLKSRFGIPPYYDWLGPNVPTHALLKYSRVPLSYFFASREAKKSILDDTSAANQVRRTCVSPFSGNETKKFSRICANKPEGRISNPAFLINLNSNGAKADGDFQMVLTAEFLKIHGVEADIFDPSSALLTSRKACFRSVVIAPGIDHVAGKAVNSNRSVKERKAVNASQVAISAADAIIQKEIRKNSDNSIQKSKTSRRKTPQGSLTMGSTVGNATEGKRNLKPDVAKNKTSSQTVRQNPTAKKPHDINGKKGTPAGRNVTSGLKTDTDTEKRAKKHLRGPSPKLQSKSVQSEDVFLTEGGVELFTHRAVDGKSWNSSSQVDPMKHIYGVCRIHRACRSHDQTILLPQWMRRYQKDLETQCGLSAVSYVSDLEFQSAYLQLQSISKQPHKPLSITGLVKKIYSEVDLDLMGTRIYRAQEQHFMTDFFHDGIHAFDALFNQRRGRHAIFKRKCMYKPDSIVGKDVVNSKDCVKVRTSTDQLSPTILLHERLKGKGPSSKYIQEVLAMMPPEGKDGPKVIYSSHLSTRGPRNSTCFRSIVLTRNSYPPRSVLLQKEQNVFFTRNNISRSSILHDISNRIPVESTCKVRLTLLKPRKTKMSSGRRQKKWASRMPSWEIQNQDEVIAKVRDLLNRTEGNVTMEVKAFSHDGRSVADAKSMIQDSEVILSVNNPAMTSIAFARPHTSVVEVQPFGYSTGPYRSFARSLHLAYRSVTAAPDEEMFGNCVRVNYQEDWGANVTLAEMEKAKDDLLLLFQNASASFDGTVSRLQLARKNNEDGTIRLARIPLERVCARSQRIRVNATRVADIVVKDALAYCAKRSRANGMPSLSGTDI